MLMESIVKNTDCKEDQFQLHIHLIYSAFKAFYSRQHRTVQIRHSWS